MSGSHRSSGSVFPKGFFSRNPFGFERERRTCCFNWKLLKQTREIRGLEERRGPTGEGRPREIRLDGNDLRIRGFHVRIPSVIWVSVDQTFLVAKPFWLRKITTVPHIFAHVNIDLPYDRYPKLKICIRIDFREILTTCQTHT